MALSQDIGCRLTLQAAVNETAEPLTLGRKQWFSQPGIQLSSGYAKGVHQEQFGFNPDQKSAWSARCVEPICAAELTSYQYRPGKGNVLLAGDAGGFMLPVTMEGIGPGVRCGVLAAESIARAVETGATADSIYFELVEPMIGRFREADAYELKVIEAREAGDNDTWFALLKQAEFEEFYQVY